MPGGKCPLSSCIEVFTTGKGKRRHVYNNGHGTVVHCSSCNEPFLSDRAREQHMASMGPHTKPTKGYGRTKRSRSTMFSTDNAQSQNIVQGLSMMTMFSTGNAQPQDIGKGLSMMPTAKKVTVPTKPLSSLYSVSSIIELNSFIATEVQPNSLFLDSSSAVVDKIVTFLQNNMPEKFRPSRVIKGGSLGKGTAVKGKSDIDLTLVVGGIGDIQTLKDKLPDILDNLEVYLGNYSGAKVVGKTTHAVQVEVTAHGETHSVDILPSLDVNVHDRTSLRDIYQTMSRESPGVRRFYSTSLSPLQLEIIKQMPTKLKSLIRIVKYWKKSETTSKKVPTSFVMELVVIHAWQSQGSPADFNIVSALKDVLSHLTQHHNFKVEFGNLRKYPIGMAQTRYGPYIIDPTNPFNDVYHGHFGKSWDWDDVSSEASRWLNMPLFGGVRREWN